MGSFKEQLSKIEHKYHLANLQQEKPRNADEAPYYQFDVVMDIPITNMVRPSKGHVLVAVADPEGRIIMGGKPASFPPGITRFSGGGMEEESDPKVAAARELKEELNLKIAPERFIHLADISINAITPKRRYSLKEHVLFVQLTPDQQIEPGDDVEEIDRLDPGGLLKLVERYKTINPKLRSTEWPEYPFLWKDYGRVYGPVHFIAYHEMVKRGLITKKRE